MCHQNGRDGALQQLRIEFCRAFKGCEQPPQALGFVFFVADGIVLLLCQLADQASGSILVERLGVQNAVQICLRCGMLRYACYFWLRDALRLFTQPAEQVRDLLLDLRRRRFGADTFDTNNFLKRLIIYRRCCIMKMVMRNEKIHFHA